ncbi:putative bis-tetraphosphatase [Mytilinidion resinicola]|uniref:Bis-tetraphosphatase n=1 Tax=Mytilinidion resinicola TaxID=574789 RepID=A0A6A6Z2V9_9PEZI|nr:putative bis-tetraphosphatase [Mytilinidion resinicola]KAF2814604.1 putative bis-tetraphosphatase [Mytilinidion resinicola]
MLLGLSEPLPHLVNTKFNVAKAAQHLLFSSTELAVVRTTTDVPFQLRYCPALAKKPTASEDDAPREKKDPFDNPSPDLWIADIPAANPTHLLVLNKFPVIVNHFILATKENKPQTHMLEEGDLDATYACLKAWEQEHSVQKSQGLFAFFNSGEHSGASQPHRHLQFLPVESMRNGEASAGWDPLIDIIASSPDSSQTSSDSFWQHPKLPFAHFVSSIPPTPTTSQLFQTYKALYNAAATSVQDYKQAYPWIDLTLHATEDGSLPISYNLAMTTTAMAILPRRNEGSMLRKDDGSEIGFVALNGTALAGTLMVKYQEEWDMLKSRPEKLDQVLEAIGLSHNPSI